MVHTFATEVVKMKHKIILSIALSIAVIATAGMIHRVESVAKYRETQESLAQEVLRFHVLANSDSQEDQDLKLKVKDEVIAYMKESLGNETQLIYTKVWAENHIGEIQEICRSVIMEEGYNYKVNAQLTLADFPLKTYGDVSFPQGTYEALRIEIGQAKGENWWCCLYPNLCFIDTTYGVVSEEGKESLQETLTEDEYDMITTAKEFKVKWFFFF